MSVIKKLNKLFFFSFSACLVSVGVEGLWLQTSACVFLSRVPKNGQNFLTVESVINKIQNSHFKCTQMSSVDTAIYISTS